MKSEMQRELTKTNSTISGKDDDSYMDGSSQPRLNSMTEKRMHIRDRHNLDVSCSTPNVLNDD